MKLPRDLSGNELAKLLRRFGYEVTRQTGSHIRATSKRKGREHHVTIPAHTEILGDAAAYLEMSREKLAEELFGK